MKYRVIKTSNSRDTICVTYEKPDGERGCVKIPVNWFFAVHKKDEEKTRDLLSKTSYIYKIENDEHFPEFIKIFCKDNYRDTVTQSRSEIVLFLEDSGVET